MRPPWFADLVAAVQANCHIADARHAGDLPLCVFLLQMREFYRWEQGRPYTETLERRALGQWLAEREAHWARIEDHDWSPLPVGDRCHDAHDVEAVNAALAPHGLAYGAGLAAAERPAFFLADLHERSALADGLQLQVCGREHARGLFAPAAALAGGRTVVLREESLQRWLWEKFEAFELHRQAGPMQALLDEHGLRDAAGVARALPQLARELRELLLLHELGEHHAGASLEPGWAQLRLALADRRVDAQVRAVRDHLADCEVTLPALVAREARAALHFWFANLDGLRQQLFPSLPHAWRAWREGDGGQAVLESARAGAAHFGALAQQVLALHAREGAQAARAIDRLLSSPQAMCVPPAGAAADRVAQMGYGFDPMSPGRASNTIAPN